MIGWRHRLHTRVMLAFASFTLLVVAMFGLCAIAFAYSVEDAFFEAALRQEAEAQYRHRERFGQWAVPRDGFVRLYTDAARFPPDLARLHASEPWRNEFPGAEGRHYHVLALGGPPGPPTWLVAEVGSRLVVRPMRESLLWLLAGTGFLLLAAALVLGYLLARRTTAPLSRLVAMVATMSPAHGTAPFAHAFGRGEVGMLAQGLEQLGRRVHAAIAREQEFTRDASHELRTPLAVIRTSAERLMAEPELSESGRQHLGHVRQSAMQLEQTVTLLLSLAREEPAQDAEVAVALVPLLERVIVEQAPLLDQRAVEVVLDMRDDARLALPLPVARVLLSNLVGNAFGHTEAGQVRIDIEDGRLRITNAGDVAPATSDWTVGGPVPRREDSSGFGLGLAIVRRLCERYGIDLSIRHDGDRATASLALTAGGGARDTAVR